jgi:predicted naringenin-chalcone synthase
MIETSGEVPPSESQSGSLRGEKRTIIMVGRSQLVSLCAGALSRPELRFSEVLVPWIAIVGALGFLMAWLVVAIMEHTGLSRYVWHLPLFFVGLVVLFNSLIGMVYFP